MAKTHTIEAGDILTDGNFFWKVIKTTDKMVTFQQAFKEMAMSSLRCPLHIPGEVIPNVKPVSARANAHYVGNRWLKWSGKPIQ